MLLNSQLGHYVASPRSKKSRNLQCKSKLPPLHLYHKLSISSKTSECFSAVQDHSNFTEWNRCLLATEYVGALIFKLATEIYCFRSHQCHYVCADPNLLRSLQRYTKTSKMAFILHVTGGSTTLIPTNCTTVTRVHHSMPVNYKPKNEPGAHTQEKEKENDSLIHVKRAPHHRPIFGNQVSSPKYNSWHKHLSHITSLLPNIILSWP